LEESEVATLPKKPASKTKPLAEDDWLRSVLLDYEVVNFAALNDDAWWIDVSQPLETVFNRAWMNTEMSKISAYLRENPQKKPASVRGWKKFVRGWLHRSYEYQRRFANGTTNRHTSRR
jgi:hypothetical protein